MKKIFQFCLYAILAINLTLTAQMVWAQDEEDSLEMPEDDGLMSDEEFDQEFAENKADDDEETNPDANKTEEEIAEDEVKNDPILNEDDEVIGGGSPEDVLMQKQTQELNLKPGLFYQNLGDKTFTWSVSATFGDQAANVKDDFESDDILPDDYTTQGVEVSYHLAKTPIYFGGLFDKYTTKNDNGDNIEMAYSYTVFGAFGGYKLIDRVVTVSLKLGLLFVSGGKRVTTNIETEAEVEDDLSFGLSYFGGILTTVNIKWFFVGFDSGLVFFNAQEIDGGDLSQNYGGYLRTHIGATF